jgi:SPP1 gp7 family putative phage head morphogenesis protein
VAGLEQVNVEAGDDTLNLLDKNALDFAATRAAELVTEISDTTRELIRDNVADAVEQGASVKKLANLLQDNYAFSAERSELIAQTESSFAAIQGNLKGWQESGVVSGFNVILGSEHDVDDECDDAVEGGPYKLGDPAPPFHPHCVCDVIPITVKEDEG